MSTLARFVPSIGVSPTLSAGGEDLVDGVPAGDRAGARGHPDALAPAELPQRLGGMDAAVPAGVGPAEGRPDEGPVVVVDEHHAGVELPADPQRALRIGRVDP